MRTTSITFIPRHPPNTPEVTSPVESGDAAGGTPTSTDDSDHLGVLARNRLGFPGVSDVTDSPVGSVSRTRRSATAGFRRERTTQKSRPPSRRSSARATPKSDAISRASADSSAGGGDWRAPSSAPHPRHPSSTRRAPPRSSHVSLTPRRLLKNCTRRYLRRACRYLLVNIEATASAPLDGALDAGAAAVGVPTAGVSTTGEVPSRLFRALLNPDPDALVALPTLPLDLNPGVRGASGGRPLSGVSNENARCPASDPMLARGDEASEEEAEEGADAGSGPVDAPNRSHSARARTSNARVVLSLIVAAYIPAGVDALASVGSFVGSFGFGGGVWVAVESASVPSFQEASGSHASPRTCTGSATPGWRVSGRSTGGET